MFLTPVNVRPTVPIFLVALWVPRNRTEADECLQEDRGPTAREAGPDHGPDLPEADLSLEGR